MALSEDENIIHSLIVLIRRACAIIPVEGSEGVVRKEPKCGDGI